MAQRNRTIDSNEDVMDSRDVIERVEELDSDRQDLLDAITNAQETLKDAQDDTSALSPEDLKEAQEAVTLAQQALTDWDEDNGEDYKAIKAFANDGSDYASDWQDGCTLIRDSYFRSYAMDLADEIGAIPSDTAWPMTCIDWDKAASELRQDYTSLDFGDVTYWVR